MDPKNPTWYDFRRGVSWYRVYVCLCFFFAFSTVLFCFGSDRVLGAIEGNNGWNFNKYFAIHLHWIHMAKYLLKFHPLFPSIAPKTLSDPKQNKTVEKAKKKQRHTYTRYQLTPRRKSYQIGFFGSIAYISANLASNGSKEPNLIWFSSWGQLVSCVRVSLFFFCFFDCFVLFWIRQGFRCNKGHKEMIFQQI